MNKKVYHTLEYYKILDMLAGYAACEETRERCLALTPLTDAAEIELNKNSAEYTSLIKNLPLVFSACHVGKQK